MYVCVRARVCVFACVYVRITEINASSTTCFGTVSSPWRPVVCRGCSLYTRNWAAKVWSTKHALQVST